MPLALKDLVLKPGRDRAVRLYHPWVFSGAVHDGDNGVCGLPANEDHGGCGIGGSVVPPGGRGIGFKPLLPHKQPRLPAEFLT